MFITSTVSAIRSRSLWPFFHAPAILPYILKTISWINVVLGILVLCDTTIDILTNVGHLDLYFMVQWFCLISWMLFDVWASLLGFMNPYDPTVDLKVNVGHCDLYFMVQWFGYILKTIWCMTIIVSLGLCDLYFIALWVFFYICHYLMPKCYIYI